MLASLAAWFSGATGFAPLLAVDFGLQFAMFAVSCALRTDHFYDMTGTSTFAILAAMSYLREAHGHPRQTLLTGLVMVWALRLGTFLVARINWYGRDPRFDHVLARPLRFLLYWTIQGVWVILTTLPVHLVNLNSAQQADLGPLDHAGIAIWAFGLAYEAIADYHKFYFRLRSQGRRDFVRTGLWRFSRHPNYFGEIVLWWGVFLVSLSGLPAITYPGVPSWALALLSPAFVTLILTRVSGVPLLEKQYKEKFGDDPKYQAYKARTPVLIPDFTL